MLKNFSCLFSYPLIMSSLLSLSTAALAQDKSVFDSTEEAPANTGDRILFPDWAPEAFDWNLGLIAGGRARKTEINDIKYDTISSEIGLGARVRGIPVVPGNPGFTLEPYASATWGNRSQKATNDTLDETDSSGFQRTWYGGVARLYYQSFRYSLDIGAGSLNYDDKQFNDLKSLRIMNDFGLLMLSHLSTHYTLTTFTVTEGKESDPSIEEVDHWLHERVAFQLFNASLDIGPGVTHTKYSGRATPTSNFDRIATVDATYLKGITSLNLIWRLGLSGSVKYILSAKEVGGINNTIDQLPNETLAENRSLANLPKGSLEASLFFGVRNLVGGLGFGWQLYYLELNNDDSPQQISRDQGLVVTYGASI